MNYTIPFIQEVSIELSHQTFFERFELQDKEIQHDLSVGVSMSKDEVNFFIHVIYAVETEEDDNDVLFHTDYVADIGIKDLQLEENQNTVHLDSDVLSHLLGMSILMIRGAIYQRLRGNWLENHSLPVISPEDVLKEDLEFVDGKFVIHLRDDEEE